MMTAQQKGQELLNELSRIDFSSQDVEYVLELIEEGADLSLRTEGDESAVSLVCSPMFAERSDGNGEENAVTILKALVKRGVSVNEADSRGETPLMCAAYQGYADIVECLLRHGADFQRMDHAKQTALVHATLGRSECSCEESYEKAEKTIALLKAEPELRKQLGEKATVLQGDTVLESVPRLKFPKPARRP